MNTASLIFYGLLALAPGQLLARQGRIIDGRDARLGEIPYLVSLQWTAENNFSYCGGSIINKDWIVTAAHCLAGESPNSTRIVAGSIDLKEAYSVHQIELMIAHEHYDEADSFRNDIGLIKVANPFEFSIPRIQSVKLPEPHVTVKTNTPVVVSGWGDIDDHETRLDTLKKVTVYVTDPNNCKTAIRKKDDYDIFYTHICASDPAATRGDCHGDSGGPLTANGVLVGITSWHLDEPSCSSPNFPSVFTRVSEYIDWIHKNSNLMN